MRHIPAFVLVTALHFVVNFGFLFIGGGIIMAAFDGEGSDSLARVAALTMAILHFPVRPLSALVPGLRGLETTGQYVLFIVNSMMWGVAVTLLWSTWRARRRG